MLALVALASGIHLPALQVVAWAGMIAGDVGEYGISTAVARTFDGEHPCCLCELVSAASDKEDAPASDMEKAGMFVLKLLPLDEIVVAERSGNDVPNAFVSWDCVLLGREERPGVPPPRFA